MKDLFDFILTISPAVTAGLFGLLSLMIQRKEARSKRNSERMEEILKLIKENQETSTENAEVIRDLAAHLNEVKFISRTNAEGVKDLLRYMLQRFHGEYMVIGYIHSHQKAEFLDIYNAYHALGGNGTGESWMQEVCSLPVRDDLPIVTPYLDLLKQERKEEIQ